MSPSFMLVELSVSYNRQLKYQQVKELAAIAAEARAVFYRNTMSWGVDGVQVLPTALFNDFDACMQEISTRFRKIALKLGMLRGEISVSYIPFPVNDPAYDFDIRVRFSQTLSRRVQTAKTDLVCQIATTINKMRDKLRVVHKGGVVKVRKFHDNIFTTALEDCHRFDALNGFTQSETIHNVVSSLRALAASNTPKEVRKNAALRASLVVQATDLCDMLSNA